MFSPFLSLFAFYLIFSEEHGGIALLQNCMYVSKHVIRIDFIAYRRKWSQNSHQHSRKRGRRLLHCKLLHSNKDRHYIRQEVLCKLSFKYKECDKSDMKIITILMDLGGIWGLQETEVNTDILNSR